MPIDASSNPYGSGGVDPDDDLALAGKGAAGAAAGKEFQPIDDDDLNDAGKGAGSSAADSDPFEPGEFDKGDLGAEDDLSKGALGDEDGDVLGLGTDDPLAAAKIDAVDDDLTKDFDDDDLGKDFGGDDVDTAFDDAPDTKDFDVDV